MAANQAEDIDNQQNNLLKFEPARPSTHSHKSNQANQIVRFDRRELNQILRVYGFRVADGEWRDYAIDMLKEKAVFSVFRRTSEMPLYMIEKNPKLTKRQGAFSIVNASGHILKRGHELEQVLRFFDRKPGLVSV